MIPKTRKEQLRKDCRVFAGCLLQSDADSMDMREEHSDEEDEYFRQVLRDLGQRLIDGKTYI